MHFCDAGLGNFQDGEVQMVEEETSLQEVESLLHVQMALGNSEDVWGDGSCFIYAVLHAQGALDNSLPNLPSSQDLEFQKQLRYMIADWLTLHPRIVQSTSDEPYHEAIERIKEGPMYENGQLVRSGSYGGLECFMALANILHTDIVVWNQRAPLFDSPCVLQDGDHYFSFQKWSFADLEKRMFDPQHARAHVPVVHVQYNGYNHYRSWRVGKNMRHRQCVDLPTTATMSENDTFVISNATINYQQDVREEQAASILEDVSEHVNKQVKQEDVVEKGLEERCMACGVNYLKPTSDETSTQRHRRREMLRKRCQRNENSTDTSELIKIARDNTENALQIQCLEHGIEYLAPDSNETCTQRKNRRRNLKRKCERVKASTHDSHNIHSKNLNASCFKALHPDERVRQAMLAFEDGEYQHSIATCHICLETRIQSFDSSTNLVDQYVERHKFEVRHWKVHLFREENQLFACDRCIQLAKKREQHHELAHPFSGWLSQMQEKSSLGQHNNMHFYPVSSYLKDLTEFEVSCLAKYSFAANVHVVGNTLKQKGCIAHVLSPMRIVKELPRLPSEIEVIIVHHTSRKNVEHRLKKQYGVRRQLLFDGIQGLLYGVPKGGYIDPPSNDGQRYVQYEYLNHIDGTQLHGRYFEVSTPTFI